MTSSLLRAHEVCLRRQHHTILNRCSLNVQEGSIYALLGANGTGKSTLLRTLVGLESFESGEIEVLGLNPERHAMQLRQQVTLVPTGGVLLPSQSLEMHLRVGGHMYPKWNAAEAFATAELFNVPHRRAARHLSTGQRIGLGLAYAFGTRPKLLILDEPTNGLDPIHRQALLSKLAEFAADGGTVLMTSHVLAEVEGIADHIGFMRNGQVVLQDAMDQLRETYKTIQVVYTREVPADVLSWLAHHHSPTDIHQQGGLIQINAHGNVDAVVDMLRETRPLDLQVLPRPLERLYASVIGGQA